MEVCGPTIAGGGFKALGKDLSAMEALPSTVAKKLNQVIDSRNLCRYVGRNERESDVSLLEKELAELIGSKYAVAFNSCSTAMFIALLCVGVRHGDEVLVPAFTFTAVPSAVLHAQAKPILVECNDDYRLDPEDLIIKATAGRRVLLLSHMRGHISDLDAIHEICHDKNIVVIEDAAHSLGASWRGVPSGRLGDIGCYSFQSHKAVDTGEGGMLVTDNEEHAVKATLYSGSFERLWECHHIDSSRFPELQKTIPTFGLRMSNVTAAIARPQLPLIEDKVRTYRRNYGVLAGMLSQSPNIRVPSHDPRESALLNSIQFALVDLTRDQIARFVTLVRTEGVPIQAIGLDSGNARAFWNWEYLGSVPDLPKTRSILERTCDLRLPVSLTVEDMRILADTILTVLSYSLDC